MVSSLQGGMPMQQNMCLGAMDRVTPEQMTRPGLYSVDQAVIRDLGLEPEKKHGGFFSGLGKLLFGTVVFAAAAIGLRKGVFNNIKGIDEVADGVKSLVKPAKDAKTLEKAKYYYAKYTDLVYDKTVGKLLAYCKSKKEAKPKDGDAGDVPPENSAGNPSGEGQNMDTKA